MNGKKVDLQVITPMGVKVKEKVDMVIMRCLTGDLGVMPGHEAYSALLDYGVLRILDDGLERKMAVFSGFAEVKHNALTILTKAAEWPEDIDRASAEADRDLAEQRLKEKAFNTEIQSDQILLRRSLVRIEVSSYPIVHKPEQNPQEKGQASAQNQTQPKTGTEK